MSIIVLNSNPGIQLDLLNRPSHEGIETTATIDMGSTRNDKSITTKVAFTIVHGSQIPLYNLRWAKLKADPNWLDQEKTKLIWKGLAVGAPPAVNINVFKLGFELPTLPSLNDFGLQLPDLSKLVPNFGDNIYKLISGLNLNLPNLEEVSNFLSSIGTNIYDFISRVISTGYEKLEELINWINTNGLNNLPKTNNLYVDFSWILDKISDSFTALESILVKVGEWSLAQITNAQTEITNFFNSIAQSSLLKNISGLLDNIIPNINLGSIDISGLKQFMQNLASYGDPFYIFDLLGKITNNISNTILDIANWFTVNISKTLVDFKLELPDLYQSAKPIFDWIESAQTWAVNKIKDFFTFLTTWNFGSIDTAINSIVSGFNNLLSVFNFQIAPLSGDLIQLPLPGIPLATIPPFYPFVTTPVPVVTPLVAWPNWMEPPHLGWATVPTQIPPGIQVGMPVIPTPGTNGIIAFQSLPGYSYSGEIEFTTSIENLETKPLGIQTFDLYLLANIDPAGTIPAGGNLSGAVARVRFTVNFLEPKVAISINPQGYNPPVTKSSRVSQLLYQQSENLYDLGVPATKVIYAQGVELKPIQFSLMDNSAVEPNMPRKYKSTYYSQISVLNIIELYKENKITLEKFTVSNSNWSASEQEPIKQGNEFIRHWYINYTPDEYDNPDDYNYFVVCTVIKNISNITTSSDGKIDLSGSGFKDNSIVVVNFEFNLTPEEKKFKNLNLPWKSVGEIFDEDIKTSPSNEQAYIDEQDVLTKKGFKYGLNTNTTRSVLSDEDIFRIILHQWNIQSFLAFSQIHDKVYNSNTNLQNFNGIQDIVTDYYSYAKKEPYYNIALTDYFKNLVDRSNNILRSNNYSFRLNKSIAAYLCSLEITDLRLNKSYAGAYVHDNIIAVNAGNLIVDSNNEIGINKLDKFTELIFIHEIIHTSHSVIYTDFSKILKYDGVNELEILTDHLSRIILHMLYPDTPIQHFINVNVGYPALPISWHLGDKQKAVLAAVQTNASNYNQTLEIIKNIAPSNIYIPERKIPPQNEDYNTFTNLDAIRNLYKSYDSLDPNRITPDVVRLLEKYPNKAQHLLLSVGQPYKRTSQGLIHLQDSWNVGDNGLLQKVAENGQLL